MKKIKFRAWDKANRQMLAVTSIIYEAIHNPNYLHYVEGRNARGEYYCLKLKDVELMQYTGLHDKNDKEIYEGDIILQRGLNGETNDKAPVIWSQRNMCFECEFRASNLNLPLAEYVEVIGNIYENKNLLEAK